MNLVASFGELQELEMELDRLEKYEGHEHKVIFLALKTKAKDYNE